MSCSLVHSAGALRSPWYGFHMNQVPVRMLNLRVTSGCNSTFISQSISSCQPTSGRHRSASNNQSNDLGFRPHNLNKYESTNTTQCIESNPRTLAISCRLCVFYAYQVVYSLRTPVLPTTEVCAVHNSIFQRPTNRSFSIVSDQRTMTKNDKSPEGSDTAAQPLSGLRVETASSNSSQEVLDAESQEAEQENLQFDIDDEEISLGPTDSASARARLRDSLAIGGVNPTLLSQAQFDRCADYMAATGQTFENLMGEAMIALLGKHVDAHDSTQPEKKKKKKKKKKKANLLLLQEDTTRIALPPPLLAPPLLPPTSPLISKPVLVVSRCSLHETPVKRME